MLTIISLGAGVQSSVMALMAAHGEIEPMPDCAIFADTQAEPKHVYEWLYWLETQLPFPVYRVTAGDLREQCLSSKGENKRFAGPPFFAKWDRTDGGMLRRQCTREFKIAPITKKVRELAGLKYRERAKGVVAEQWIGISTDEIQRMKDPREKWLKHRWPLIEKNMTRLHCLEWMRDKGYNQLPAKSACTFCPYRDDKGWADMKENDPESFEDACRVDEGVREGVNNNTQAELYVHRSMVPLREVDFWSPSENQNTFSFMDECDGMCGV